jgi:SagB-type dehydrogenase family enzyme
MAEPSELERYRYFLKDTIRRKIDFSQTGQSLGELPPPIEKPFSAEAQRVDLAPPGQWKGIDRIDLETAMRNRKSRRNFKREALSLEELSFLLWATQGLRQQIDRFTALRIAPSAGARHALETYLCVFNVDGLEPAIYRYLPLEHQLLWEFEEDRAAEKLREATLGQSFIARSAATFIWTTIPRRMEWRYDLAAHKVIAIDAGHACQNLYLACEAVGAGTCAVAAYDQEGMDRLLGVDGEEEFTVYLAPVGKVSGPGD